MGIFDGIKQDDTAMGLFKNGYRKRVVRSQDFQRIAGIPRRIVAEPVLSTTITGWTEALKTRAGTQRLWPLQIRALEEAAVVGGGFFPLAVGAGKTLPSLLLPRVLQAKRPLLLVPAQLREQTINFVLPVLNKHWKLPDNLTIHSYSELSLIKNCDLLDDLHPDLIIADECHKLKNPRCARTRRFMRYFREYPDTMFVGLSGTITRKSLRDYAHLIKLALKDNSPLPHKWGELAEWARYRCEMGAAVSYRDTTGASERGRFNGLS